MAVISISLPDDLVAELDEAIAAGGYKGRSEYLRAAVRQAVQSQRRASGHVHGSITVVYEEGNEPRVSEARHAYHDVVLAMLHSHCEPTVCMDVLSVGGAVERVQALQDTLARMRQVRRSVLVPVA